MGRRRRSSSCGGGSVKHTEEFYRKKYREYIEYTIIDGGEDRYHSLNGFISGYEYYRNKGVKNVMKELKYLSKHVTHYETARAMLKKAKEFGDTRKLKDFQDIATYEFADQYIDELRAEQKEAKSMYGNAYDGYIGVMWFGSD